MEQPPEAGVLPAEALRLDVFRRGDPSTSTSSSPPAASSSKRAANPFAYPPAERNQIRDSWDALMRWSKVFAKAKREGDALLDGTEKVVIFGGGSFGTAMGCALARQRPTLDVVLLVRDPYLCRDINTLHENTRYLKVRVWRMKRGWACGCLIQPGCVRASLARAQCAGRVC